MYPIWVGFERRSATKPSLNTPASTVIAPTINARAEPYATAVDGSPLAATIGMTVAAIIGPREESGPRTRTRLGPNRA